MTDRELMQKALEALSAMLTHMGMDEDDWNKPTFNQCRKAEAALRERLAQPEQEPLGIFNLTCALMLGCKTVTATKALPSTPPRNRASGRG